MRQAPANLYFCHHFVTAIKPLRFHFIWATILVFSSFISQGQEQVARKLVKEKAEGAAESDTPIEAIANITMPLQGQGIHIIPTPSFNFTQAQSGKRSGFSMGVWGNTLGIDSLKEKIVSSLLAPQVSLFGLKADGVFRLSPNDKDWSFAVAAQFNTLLKKVSYYDTSSKDVSSFNPLAIQPRIGAIATFFDNDVFIGWYWNVFSVVTKNSDFKSFFESNKATVSYANINFGGVFDFKGGKQSIKVELDFIFHNGQTRKLFQTEDKVIPYLKIGLLSEL